VEIPGAGREVDDFHSEKRALFAHNNTQRPPDSRDIAAAPVLGSPCGPTRPAVGPRMKFSWFIALRYLKPKGTFLSVITLISIAGVALGVGVLLVVIAVMSGFEQKIKEDLLQAEPALTIKPNRPGSDLPTTATANTGSLAAPGDWRSISTTLKQHPEVRTISAIVTVTSVLQRKPTPEEETAIQAGAPALPEAQCILIGVDPRDTVQMERLNRLMAEQGSGSFELAGESIVINQALANRLDQDGQLVLGTSAANIFGPAFLREYRQYYQEKQRAKKDTAKLETVEAKDRDLPLPAEYVIQGVIDDDQTGRQPTGYISLKNAQNLAGTGKGIDGLTITLTDAFRAGEVKLDLRQKLPSNWETITWTERNKRFFNAISNERGMMYLVLGIISIVAAFCIMNTMITMAVQKRKEIGMMRALGAKTSQIITLFVAKGLIVAGFGVGTGYLLGKAVLHWRNDLNQLLATYFNIEIPGILTDGRILIPAALRLSDTLVICGVALILCTLAAVPPAWIVGRMDPARALRSEA
jgi:lipoprotein-releasing system permease protein